MFYIVCRFIFNYIPLAPTPPTPWTWLSCGVIMMAYIKY